MKIENRQKFLVILAIVAAGLYVGVNFIFTPLQDWWKARSTQIATLREQVKQGNYQIKYEANTRGRWSEMRSNALPADTSLAEQQVFTSLDDWSRSTGVEVASLMPQWKADSTNYMTLTCHVEASGDIGSLTRFIYDMEKGPMPIRLDSIEMGSHDNTGQQLTLSLDLDGLALIQNQTK
jgi:Tfp pilus assembly protein PilO